MILKETLGLLPKLGTTPKPWATSQALFSDSFIYRYELWRQWAYDVEPRIAMFIGLNPSTADEKLDDPTVRRCIGYAKREGCGALCMTNLFALRSTDPKKLYEVSDPVGPDNDLRLRICYGMASLVVACWGQHGKLLDRGDAVRNMLGNMKTFGLNNDGTPKHPLYLKKTLRLIDYP